MNSHQVFSYKITTDTFARFFAFLIGLLILWGLRDIVISILVSVVIASAISPLASKMRKFWVPRSLTVFTVLAVIIAIFVGIFVLLVPTIYNEFNTFSKSFYVFQRDAINYISSYTGNKQFVSDVIRDWSLEDIQNAFMSAITAGTGAVASTAGAVTYFVIQTIFIFVLTFYLAVLPDGVKLLMLHNEDDPVVHIEPAKKFAENTAAKFVTFKTGGHRAIGAVNEPRYWKHIDAFFKAKR
jgi:predicted PurR-regulated permease PerM